MSLALEPPIKHRVVSGRTKTLRAKRLVFQLTQVITWVSPALPTSTIALTANTNPKRGNPPALMPTLATMSAVTAIRHRRPARTEPTRRTAAVGIAMMHLPDTMWIRWVPTLPRLVRRVHLAPNTARLLQRYAPLHTQARTSIRRAHQVWSTVPGELTILSRAPILRLGASTQTLVIMWTNKANSAKRCVLREPTTQVQVQPQKAIASSPLQGIIPPLQVKRINGLAQKEPTNQTPIQPPASMPKRDGMPTARGTRPPLHVQAAPTTQVPIQPTLQIASRLIPAIMRR